MLTVLFAVLSGIPSLQTLSQEITNVIFNNFLPDTGVKIQTYLNDFAKQVAAQ